jgi:hypothetical protein
MNQQWQDPCEYKQTKTRAAFTDWAFWLSAASVALYTAGMLWILFGYRP